MNQTQQTPRSTKGLVWAYIAIVNLGALALVVLTWHPPTLQEWPTLLALVLLTVVASNLRIGLYGRSHTAVYIPIIITGALLYGPTIAALLALIAAIGRLPWTSRPRTYIFDAGMLPLTFGLVSLLAPLVEQLQDWNRWLGVPLGGLIVASYVYLINWSLLIAVMALDEWTSPLRLWRECAAWLTPYHLVFGLLGVSMVAATEIGGIYGLLLFSLPIFMLRLAIAQYVAQTRSYVDKLRQAHEHLEEEHEALEQAHIATNLAFTAILNARDQETDGHSERVVVYAVAIGRALNLSPDEMTTLETGARLHDIGKIGVSDAILRKAGPLTETEWIEMRRHTEVGANLIAQIPHYQSVVPIVRHHHERWDGAGYPDRLCGEDIPLLARIFAVADALDAILSDRPYRAGRSMPEALAEIERNAGSHFDPTVVAALLDTVMQGAFPVIGSPASPLLVPSLQERAHSGVSPLTQA